MSIAGVVRLGISATGAGAGAGGGGTSAAAASSGSVKDSSGSIDEWCDTCGYVYVYIGRINLGFWVGYLGI